MYVFAFNQTNCPTLYAFNIRHQLPLNEEQTISQQILSKVGHRYISLYMCSPVQVQTLRSAIYFAPNGSRVNQAVPCMKIQSQ